MAVVSDCRTESHLLHPNSGAGSVVDIIMKPPDVGSSTWGNLECSVACAAVSHSVIQKTRSLWATVLSRPAFNIPRMNRLSHVISLLHVLLNVWSIHWPNMMQGLNQGGKHLYFLLSIGDLYFCNATTSKWGSDGTPLPLWERLPGWMRVYILVQINKVL